MAFICDIEGMFLQVNVNDEHRNLLRFLWWEEGNVEGPLVDYYMTVHLFGVVSSTGCSNFALRRQQMILKKNVVMKLQNLYVMTST